MFYFLFFFIGRVIDRSYRSEIESQHFMSLFFVNISIWHLTFDSKNWYKCVFRREIISDLVFT